MKCLCQTQSTSGTGIRAARDEFKQLHGAIFSHFYPSKACRQLLRSCSANSREVTLTKRGPTTPFTPGLCDATNPNQPLREMALVSASEIQRCRWPGVSFFALVHIYSQPSVSGLQQDSSGKYTTPHPSATSTSSHLIPCLAPWRELQLLVPHLNLWTSSH